MMLPSEVELFRRERAEMQRVIDAREQEDQREQCGEGRVVVLSIAAWILFALTVMIYAF